jgi:hypothetical protein
MARINIEASAALAEWIDLLRDEPRKIEDTANKTPEPPPPRYHPVTTREVISGRAA